MVYTLRFFFISSKCSLLQNSNVFGSCVHILYTGCAKIKKNNSGAKRLKTSSSVPVPYLCMHKSVADISIQYKDAIRDYYNVANFDVLLTVHLSINLVINQLDAQNLVS